MHENHPTLPMVGWMQVAFIAAPADVGRTGNNAYLAPFSGLDDIKNGPSVPEGKRVVFARRT